MPLLIAVLGASAVLSGSTALQMETGLLQSSSTKQILGRVSIRGSALSLLQRIGSSPLGLRAGNDGSIRRTLELAGRPISMEVFRGLKLTGALGSAALVLALLRASATTVLLLPLLAGAAWRVPEFVMARLVKKRQMRIDARVPDLVEVLVSTAEAGMNPALAVRRSARLIPGSLGDELMETVRWIDLGVPWRDAMDKLLERTRVPSLQRLVTALSRSHRLGTPVSAALRRVADELRGERRAQAEELARRAPVKMLFPLVFLILPAFLLLTVGPVVLSTLRSLR